MNAYNAAISALPMPHRIAALPVSAKGYPVPWFVAKVDGAYDFRVVAPNKLRDAVRWHKCWICGQMLGKFQAVVVGPMCVVNRVSAEPGSHRDCAVYAATACPFLNNPRMRRRVDGLPDDAINPAGVMLARNPGATAVWVTQAPVSPFKAGDGVLFRFKEPSEVLWFAEGRTATRQEIVDSISSGLPELVKLAEREGAAAMVALHRAITVAAQYLPRAAPGDVVSLSALAELAA